MYEIWLAVDNDDCIEPIRLLDTAFDMWEAIDKAVALKEPHIEIKSGNFWLSGFRDGSGCWMKGPHASLRSA